ncbi:MAG: SUMF1/EgtB/PvdO family nonheme iron enzyme [Candidatus Omnitrophica bacterium]|nr:SUMF1/EgtB/PvdO family nonheme iron enzyme [Candidatus Omnitrophota bacterium]
MVKKTVLFIFFFSCLLLVSSALANNITVTNVTLQNLDSASGKVEVKFDLNWENYFSGTDGNSQAYFDRAWVFVKFYRADTDTWNHARLTTGGNIGAYSSSTKLGITSDGVGAFCKPGAGQTVIWNYAVAPVTLTIANPCVITYAKHGLAANAPVIFSTNGSLPTGITAGTTYYVKSPATDTFNISTTPAGASVSTSGQTQSGQHYINSTGIMSSDSGNLKVKVMAIEMVYIPQGSFVLGSGGTETDAFYEYPTTTNPYTVSSENAINVGATNGYLYCPSVSNTYPGDRTGPIPAAFPKGYNGFFLMKYQIAQGQYRDFLNTLTRTQQASRCSINAGRFAMNNSATLTARNGIRNPDSIPAGSVTFGCDLNSNGIFNEADDGEYISCFMSEADGRAYADWAGLRPYTELEYEKAARGGGVTPVANEYVWGSTNYTQVTSVVNSGKINETVLPSGANSNYGNNAGGALRAGFSATSASTREQAGAGYYGVMDLASGGLYEKVITSGTSQGRAFTGLNGNGFLNSSGNSDVTNWPGSNGIGFRGGDYDNSDNLRERLSDRYYGAYNNDGRSSNYGFRCARTE